MPDKNKTTQLIGALHFSPSPGYEGFDSVEKALQRAQTDLDNLIAGGIDSVIFENNYDLPHSTKVGPNTCAFMSYLIAKLKFKKKINFGISVLWNDYETAFSLATVTGAQFIRIPAFVDSVKSEYGVAEAVADELKVYRKKIGAEKIKVYADVHVKHAEMLDKNKTLPESIRQAEKAGADGIIITGKWTGDSPNLSDLKLAKETTSLPIIVGSGANKNNVKDLQKYCDMVIVSTALKEGDTLDKEKNPNLKSFDQRLSQGKTAEFVKTAKT